MGIKHSFTSNATPDPAAGTSIVGPNEWNADHVILGSPDTRPTSPSSYDDEFEGTGFTGWTTLGTPLSHNINSTVKGHYYASVNAPTAGWSGIYKAIPFPSTVIVKVSDFSSYFSSNKSGVVLMPSTLDKAESAHLGDDGTRKFVGQIFTTLVTPSSTTFSSANYYEAPFYIKIVFSSATQYSVYGSSAGIIWNPMLVNRTAGFTIAYVGLAVKDETVINTVESAFDFFRVTQP